MRIMVRDAVPSDAAVTAMLITELGYPASVEFATERLAHFTVDLFSRVQVAERDDGEVVGLVATHVVPGLDNEIASCRVVDIVVAPSERRNGVGTALICAAEAEARRQQCQRLDLSSGDWREDAHAFNERLGFETQSRGFVKRLHCS
jgi:N-acetylglutamate synthase-like GNAT family acetyltransferase